MKNSTYLSTTVIQTESYRKILYSNEILLHSINDLDRKGIMHFAS